MHKRDQSDESKAEVIEYLKENYKQVKLSMPIEEAEALELYCKEKGHTRAGFIRQAIKDKMERGE